MRTCGTCKTLKADNQFIISNRWQCRECRTAYARRFRNTDKGKIYIKLSKIGYYNLTEEQFDKLLEEQDNRCAICQKFFTEKLLPKIDHDHTCCPARANNGSRPSTTCGKCVRGLLCNKCNVGLGMMEDNIEYLISAIKYLSTWEPKEYLSAAESLEMLKLVYTME